MIVLISILCSVTLAASSTQPAGVPAIVADADEHDFGQVRANEKVEHRFKITNTGAADLNITNVRTNCGRAVAGEYPRRLAPGASGEIPPALNTANMNGPFKKTATVYSNDMKSSPADQRSAGVSS